MTTMAEEIERPLIEHLESQEFEDTAGRLAIKSRIGKRIRLGDEVVFGEVIDCSILDLTLTDLAASSDDATALAQGTFVEALRPEGAGELESESRRGTVTGYLKVRASFPRQSDNAEAAGYLSDLEIDIGELEWIYE